MKYSVTTVSLPEFTLLEQVQLLSRLGYNGIEMRVRRNPEDGKPGFWGVHKNDLNPENLLERAREIRQVLDDYGLQLPSLAGYMRCTELEDFKRVLEGAVACGARAMRVGAAAAFTSQDTDCYKVIYGETVAGFARCLEFSRGSGVKLIMEAHGGTIHSSASLGYRILSNFSPAEVGFIYDPNNMVRDGFETTAVALQLLGDYLAHCHVAGHYPVAGVADANGTVAWKWEKCPLAAGLYNFPELFRCLRKLNYQGFISLEDYRDQLPAEFRCREGLEYMQKLDQE